MSVLIRGMKLPKFCRACRFAGFGGRKCELNVCMFTGESQPTLSPERMSKCPLVEIPPHGDLIDRDAAAEKIWDDMKFPSNLANAQFYVNELREMPTVIPAEEEN